MKFRTILLILAILVIAFLVYRKIKSSADQPANNPVAGKPQPLMVSAMVIKPQTISDKIIASGSVTANAEVELRNELAGKIVKIFFKEGSKVNKGEMLVKMFDSDLQAQLTKVQLQLQLAEKKESRIKDLLGINGVSQQEYDETLNQLNSTKADIDLLKSQIEKTSIKAPFTGIIGLKTVSEGTFLAANTRIATMQEIDPLKIDFSVPERYMNLFHTGDEINFSVAGSDETFKGNVYAIEPRIDLATRSIAVRALCPNKSNKIFPGAFARIEMQLKEIKDAIMIPTQALIPELKGQKVFISKNDKATPAKVETGLRNDSTIQITKGLNAGDTLITTGILQLRPDVPLKIVSVK